MREIHLARKCYIHACDINHDCHSFRFRMNVFYS